MLDQIVVPAGRVTHVFFQAVGFGIGLKDFFQPVQGLSPQALGSK